MVATTLKTTCGSPGHSGIDGLMTWLRSTTREYVMLFAPVALELPDVVAEPVPDARISTTQTDPLVETARRNAPWNMHSPSLVVRSIDPSGGRVMRPALRRVRTPLLGPTRSPASASGEGSRLRRGWWPRGRREHRRSSAKPGCRARA